MIKRRTDPESQEYWRKVDEIAAQGKTQHAEPDAPIPEWVVNDSAELGVKVGNRYFFLYKGESLEYKDGKHDDGSPMYVRPVGKREFGECCHPVKMIVNGYITSYDVNNPEHGLIHGAGSDQSGTPVKDGGWIPLPRCAVKKEKTS